MLGSVNSGVGSTLAVGPTPLSIGAVNVSSNVTLQGTTALKLDPASLTNDVLYAYGITYGGTLNVSNLSTALIAGSSARLFVATNYAGVFSAIVPITPGPGLAWNTNNLAVDGTLAVMYTPGDTWKGAIDGIWDISTANWSSSGLPANYLQGDVVTFDDSVVGATTVNLTATTTPASITFNNSFSNYVVTGSGSLSGPIGIVKNYPGILTLAETGGDNFTGGVTVNNGTLILDNANSVITGNTIVGAPAILQSGNNDGLGALPSGNISLNGRLVVSRTNNVGVGNLISGFGSLIKNNNNVLTLTRNNLNWTGSVTVVQGTLQLASVNAVGFGTNVPVTVNNGATLDVNGVVGTNSVIVSGSGVNGNGAIVNNNGSVQALPALAFMRMTGNTTIGGANRWDLRPAGSSPDTASASLAGLSTAGQPYSLIKTGANFIGLVSATVDPKLANVTIQSGTLDLEGNLTGLGNPANLLTVFSNATLETWNLTTALDKVVILNDGAIVLNGSGANQISGAVVLATNAPASAGNCTFNIGGSYLWLTGGVSGRGNLIKTGGSILYLNTANTYTGSTRVNAGRLSLFNDGTIYKTTNINVAAGAFIDATGISNGTLAITNGQTLQGSGTVTGILMARSGSTIMPGVNLTSTGTLTVSSNATLQGACFMKLTPGINTCDVLRVNGSLLTLGGSLTVSNISAAPLAAGNSYRLFSANTYAGGFSSLNPPTPGIGLAWNTNNLSANGTLSIVALPQPGIDSFTLVGANLILNGTNGVANRPYVVLMSSDIMLPRNQWTPILTNTFATAGNFTITAVNAVDAAAAQRFFTLQAQ
jgi:fibronectin-binding autotransporter adhesin